MPKVLIYGRHDSVKCANSNQGEHSRKAATPCSTCWHASEGRFAGGRSSEGECGAGAAGGPQAVVLYHVEAQQVGYEVLQTMYRHISVHDESNRLDL